MRLTRKKAIEITLELWRELAVTGHGKGSWSGWGKYGKMQNDCAFCEYESQKTTKNDEDCFHCPYYQKFSDCEEDNSPYTKWREALNPNDRCIYAGELVKQLEQL